MEQRLIGKELHKLNNAIRRHLCKNTSALKAGDEITGTNLRIIRFLKSNEHRDIYQKDVEKEFGITRSTASRVLTLMEQKGLVMRSGVEHDARLKRVTLTERSKAFGRNMAKRYAELEDRLFSGFTKEEEEMVLGLIKRMHDNLD